MDWNRLYLEAVKQENDYRDAAFLELTGKICGLRVRPMIIPDRLILDGLGSPFMQGGRIYHRDVVQFLWHLNPSYRNSKWRAYLFGVHCRGLDFEQALVGIKEYLARTFMDSPGGSLKAEWSAPWCSWVANLVDAIASEYGWPLEKIMNCPLRILYQQLRTIRKRHNPKVEFINKLSRSVLGERLRLKQARLDLVNLLARRN